MKNITRAAKTFQRDVRARLGIAMAGAFAFVIALSWNEFMKELVNRIIMYFGMDGKTLLLKLGAALIVTIICVLGIKFSSSWTKE